MERCFLEKRFNGKVEILGWGSCMIISLVQVIPVLMHIFVVLVSIIEL